MTALPVAFVGVGRMGTAMARCVVGAGHPVVVHDPDPDAVTSLLDGNPDRVGVAATPGEAAAQATVVVLVVNTDSHVLDACLGPDGIVAGARPQTILVVHSTIDPDTLRRVAGAAEAAGVQVLDAGVSGRMGERSAGDLCVMVGGDPDAFARARPVLDTYGGLVLHLGPLGSGLDAKLALNLLRYLSYITMQEAGRLAVRAGVAGAMGQIVQHTGASAFVGDISAHQNQRPIEDLPRRRNNAATARKDLLAALARGKELGLDLPFTSASLDLLPGLWALDADGEPTVS